MDYSDNNQQPITVLMAVTEERIDIAERLKEGVEFYSMYKPNFVYRVDSIDEKTGKMVVYMRVIGSLTGAFQTDWPLITTLILFAERKYSFTSFNLA